MIGAEGGLRTQGRCRQDLPEGPLITVITVVFNGADHLEETLLSVIGQTWGNVEYIVVDGGSTDGTLDIIRRHEHAIDYWVSAPDAGIYDAMNKGIGLATGRWINFMNAGDSFCDARVLEQVAPHFDDDTLMVYGDAVIFDDTYRKRLRAKKFDKTHLVLLGTRVLCHQAMFVRRTAAPLFNTAYSLKAELFWYFDMLETGQGACRHVDLPVVDYRLGGVSARRFGENILQHACVLLKKTGPFAIFGLPILSYMLMSLVKRRLINRRRKPTT